MHAVSPEEADPWFARAGLADLVRISDPALAHYRAFGLGLTGAGELVSPRVWARGTACALAHGFGAQPGRMLRQLPGVFVILGDRILAAFRHRSPADRPDYLGLIAASTSITMP